MRGGVDVGGHVLCLAYGLAGRGEFLQVAEDHVVELNDRLVHCFFDEHRDAVAEEAFENLAPYAFVEGSGAFFSVDLEDGGEDSGTSSSLTGALSCSLSLSLSLSERFVQRC